MAATEPPELPPVSEALRRSTRTAIDGDGAYVRDDQAVWRDARDGSAIPDACDYTLADLFDPPALEVDGRRVRIVPRAWASRHPEHPLAWVFEHVDIGSRGDIVVPAAAWDARADLPVAMDAAELHPHNLVGLDAVADLIGVTPGTVRSYLARQQMPRPIARLGGSPIWPRALIERWLPTRRSPNGSSPTVEEPPPTVLGG